MRDYVHLHRKIGASWVFEAPRRLQLFIFLLAKADERGVVRLSVNECAKRLDINRNSLRTILRQMEDEGVVHQQPTNKRPTNRPPKKRKKEKEKEKFPHTPL